jgi:mRNA interferase MazF
VPEQGDILLIPIPFTDLSSQKRRPVIVISNDAYNRSTADIVVVAMTSNPTPADYSFTITSSDLTHGTSRFAHFWTSFQNWGKLSV